MAIIPSSQSVWRDVRIRRAQSYENMSESIVLSFIHHGEPYSIVEQIPWVDNDPRTATAAIHQVNTIGKFIRLLVTRYFQETMTPMNDDDAQALGGRIAQVMYIPPPVQASPPEPPPPPSLDPDITSALSIADEGMKLQKEIIEKTTRYQKKVKAHYDKYGSAIPSLHK